MNQIEENIDAFLECIKFLTPNEIINLYESDSKYMDLFELIQKQIPNFALSFHYIIKCELVVWFHKKNIPLKLLKKYEYKIENGIKCEYWYLNGQYHRDNDLPAIIFSNGHKCWVQYNKLHRDNDLPAVIESDGTQHWYQNDKLHRDNDLPAIIYNDGSQKWYQNGELHRDGDLPAWISNNALWINQNWNIQEWYYRGKLHRDNDLPAIIYNDGSQKWYQNGELHRDNDLPAVIYAFGGKEWYRYGTRYSRNKNEILLRLKQRLNNK